jgi:polar amino acid transport system substrate-binding protein
LNCFHQLEQKTILDNHPQTIFFSCLGPRKEKISISGLGQLLMDQYTSIRIKSDERNITTIDDLKKLERIACRHAGLIPSLLLDLGFKNLDMTASDSSQIYTKLVLKRCDAAISDTDLGVKHYLRTMNLDQETFSKYRLHYTKHSYIIAFTRDFTDEYIMYGKVLSIK